jgi:hypothetical protein
MLATSKVGALCLHSFFFGTSQTSILFWLICHGECCVGIAVQDHSTKVLCGLSKDTMPFNTEWLAAAGLLTFASYYKLVASVGSLPLYPQHTTVILYKAFVNDVLRKPKIEWWLHYHNC